MESWKPYVHAFAQLPGQEAQSIVHSWWIFNQQIQERSWCRDAVMLIVIHDHDHYPCFYICHIEIICIYYIYIVYIHIYILYIHFYIHIDVLVYTCLIFKVTYHLWFSKIFLILHVLLTLQVPRSPAFFEAPSPRGCGKWCDSVIEEVSPRVIFFGLKPSIAIPYIHIIHVLVFYAYSIIFIYGSCFHMA